MKLKKKQKKSREENRREGGGEWAEEGMKGCRME